MMLDIIFLGLPLVIGICLATIAMREQNAKFWRCSFSFIAYCAFYIVAGREVIAFFLANACVAGGWLFTLL